MTKRIGSSYAVVAALALAVSPAAAAGEGQGQTYQGEQGGSITKKINVNERVSFPAAGGCQYTASVNGTIAPVTEKEKGGSKSKGQSQASNQLSSDLRVNAQLSCPNKAVLRVQDTVSRTGPMTPVDLEHAIERRATILVEEAGTQCAFMPNFQLGNNKLTGTGVAYLCATKTQGQGSQSSM